VREKGWGEDIGTFNLKMFDKPKKDFIGILNLST
jgi:hypothetical protein